MLCKLRMLFICYFVATLKNSMYTKRERLSRKIDLVFLSAEIRKFDIFGELELEKIRELGLAKITELELE